MSKIRTVRESDIPELLAIQAPYVLNTAITFEYEVPSAEEFQRRIQKTLLKYPYLVLEEEGKILGYAYASTYYDRRAYDWSVELSIYLHQDAKGRGLGSILYDHLEEELKSRGFLRFLACIALPNDRSISLHQKRGYKQVAHFPKIGYKFGKWHDIVWMQKSLTPPDEMSQSPSIRNQSS